MKNKMKKINKTNLIYVIAILYGSLVTVGNALVSMVNNMYTISDLAIDMLYFIGVYMFIEVLHMDTKKEN